MINPFWELSFSFVIDLYRVKKAAEQRNDTQAVHSLNQQYPELFTEEFDQFIENVKLTTAFLDQKYGENFSSILEPKYAVDHGRKLDILQ